MTTPARLPAKQVGAIRSTHTFDCVAGVSVGDWVYQDPSTSNLAVEATNNTAVPRIVGRVIVKPVATRCEVLLIGAASDAAFSGVRGSLWLQTNGTAGATIPSTGYRHKLGESFGDGTYTIDTSPVRMKNSS